MSKRDAFWDSLGDDEWVHWPDDAKQRDALAARIVGARLVGAVESVAADRLAMLDGVPPVPGDNYQRRLEDVNVLATLSPEQKDVVRRMLISQARSSLYRPLVKLRNIPGGAVELRVVPVLENDTELPPCDLTAEKDLHAWFFDWVDEFADLIEPDPSP